MAMTLAEIRAKLQAQENKTGGNNFGGDNSVFAHWNIPEGSEAVLRFLPDGDSANSFFWVERLMIRLPFAGIKGQTDSKPVQVQVPCVEMYGGMTCPILAEVRTWFKDSSLEEMGRKYWKKKSYLFQGFVRENPLKDDNTPENPIRRFIISPQIFNLIKAALMDSEIENLPTDYQSGLDFRVIKTSKGGYADYSTSTWKRKESALTAVELAAVEQYGLFKLTEFLPKKPTDVELKIIKEMFDASVDGQPYDTARWGNYYKPAGMMVNTEAVPAATAKVVDADDSDDDTPVAAAPVATSVAKIEKSAETPNVKRADDILALIRNRQKTA
jgi:hypothetical protein